MSSFADFFKSIGGAIQNDVNQSHGGFKNFAEGMLGGVQDKFNNITPQQRFQMDMAEKRQEDEEAERKFQEEFENRKQSNLEQFHRLSLEGRAETRDIRQQQFETSEANKFAAAGLKNEQSVEASGIAQENRLSLQDDSQAHDEKQNRLDRELRTSQAADKAKALSELANSFSPKAMGLNFQDYAVDQDGELRSPEEHRAAWKEAKDSAKVAHTEGRQQLLDEAEAAAAPLFGDDRDAFGPEGSEGRLQFEAKMARDRAKLKRDEGVADATTAAEEPGADFNEIEEAEADKISSIADFERQFSGSAEETRFGGSGDSAASGDSSAEPALIEQSSAEENKAEDSRGEIAQFRQLMDDVLGGDGDAATKLNDITSGDNLENFTSFGEIYGEEALDQLRHIYRQKMGADAPF